MTHPPWRVLGVDNGTSALGLCRSFYDVDKAELTVNHLHTCLADKSVYQLHPRLYERKGANAARRQWIKEFFIDYLLDFEPDVVAIETPFIGGRDTLNNFAPLTLSLDGLIDCVLWAEDILDKRIYIEKVAPHEAKRAVMPIGGKFDSNKEVVKPNIIQCPNIQLNDWDLDAVSLDAVDAIAIAYACTLRVARY